MRNDENRGVLRKAQSLLTETELQFGVLVCSRDFELHRKKGWNLLEAMT